MSYTPRLKTRYKEEIVPKLKDKFEYKNIMEVPKVTKVCLNQGLGQAIQDKKILEVALEEMTKIAGQKAVATKAKKAVSNFKLRDGMNIGARVTLRGDQMYEFIDRLVSVSLPRVRDFQGINGKSFDGRGNYSFGTTEQIIFPEINIDKVNKLLGMDITFVTNAKTDEEAKELLKEIGVPFKN
jgi:large subunit ribosomal protein L5